jgi:hypothetical protein
MGDNLVGVSTRSLMDWQHPYPGLKAFTEADVAFFYGRKAEQSELFRMVKRLVLTTCFGASGLGKTSVLGAGLFPLLREALFFPVLTRLDFSPSGGGLVAQVKRRFRQEAAQWQVEMPEPESQETLWEYFHRARFWDKGNRLLMPVLVLDQLEEIFTLGAGDQRVSQFKQELADLIENRIPASARHRFADSDEPPPFSLDRQHYRVLLSLREDFLPHLEDFQSVIPSLSQNRFRLTAMNGVQALEAILKPGKEVVTREVALEIVRVICGRAAVGIEDLTQALDRLLVEPTLLSLFCHELNNLRTSAGLQSITSYLLKGAGDQIVIDFYERTLSDRKAEVRTFVEERLLTGSGFRRAEAVEDAIRLLGVTRADIDELVNRRLLRTEERLGIPHVELIHDVLTGVVGQSRNRRRLEEEKRRQRARILRRSAIAAVLCLVVIAGLAWEAVRAREQATQAQLLADQEATLARTNRQLLQRYDELAKKLERQASPTERAAFSDLRAQVTEQDVCAKYALCGYNRIT